MTPKTKSTLGSGERKTLANTIFPYSRMNYPLRDKIARRMWAMWAEANSPHLDGFNCPREYYLMSEIAMKCVIKEMDDMILDIMKKRLENLYQEDS